MEKLLIASFLSLLAAFLTAFVSIVKLVVEKENKTSEFRQQWTNSVRDCMSEFAAKLTGMTAAINYQSRLTRLESMLEKKNSEVSNKRLEMVRTTLLKVREDITTMRHDQYKYYSLCKLHFKPDDKHFAPIEKLFEEIRDSNLSVLSSFTKEKLDEIRNSNFTKALEIIEQGRAILKEEWERVKKGEKSFITTKTYSFYGGVITLVLLIAVAVYTYNVIPDLKIEDSIAKVDQHSIEKSKNEKINIENSKCWELSNLNKRIFKINLCTGELIEITK